MLADIWKGNNSTTDNDSLMCRDFKCDINYSYQVALYVGIYPLNLYVANNRISSS